MAIFAMLLVGIRSRQVYQRHRMRLLRDLPGCASPTTTSMVRWHVLARRESDATSSTFLDVEAAPWGIAGRSKEDSLNAKPSRSTPDDRGDRLRRRLALSAAPGLFCQLRSQSRLGEVRGGSWRFGRQLVMWWTTAHADSLDETRKRRSKASAAHENLKVGTLVARTGLLIASSLSRSTHHGQGKYVLLLHQVSSARRNRLQNTTKIFQRKDHMNRHTTIGRIRNV